MESKINCVMLIDDNKYDNYFHERVIKDAGYANNVIIMSSAVDALDYLKNTGAPEKLPPDLIFLDINMPRMNGWEFMEEYKNLPKAQQSRMIVVMLTTSENTDDQSRSYSMEILTDFKTKPLTEEMLNEIVEKHFN